MRGVPPSQGRQGRYDLVLVAVDLGPSTSDVIAEGLRIGHEQGSMIVVLFVAPAAYADEAWLLQFSAEQVAALAALFEKRREATREFLIAEVRRLGAGRLPPLAAALVVSENGREGLDAVINEIEPDLVVMAAHSRNAADIGASALDAGTPIVVTPAAPDNDGRRRDHREH